jgi:hypothetical protein
MGYSVEPMQIKALSELLVIGQQVVEGAVSGLMVVRPVLWCVVHANRPPMRA